MEGTRKKWHRRALTGRRITTPSRALVSNTISRGNTHFIFKELSQRFNELGTRCGEKARPFWRNSIMSG